MVRKVVVPANISVRAEVLCWASWKKRFRKGSKFFIGFGSRIVPVGKLLLSTASPLVGEADAQSAAGEGCF